MSVVSYWLQQQIKFMKIDNTKRTPQDYQHTLQTALNYAEALRQFKHADSLLEKRKKQLRVQAVKAHRGSWIDQEFDQKEKLRQEIKADNEKVQAQLQSRRVKQMQRIEQFKKRSEKLRQENFKNREKSRLQLLENRLRAKHEIRMKSIEHEEKLRSKFNETMRRKQSLCQDVYNSRKLSKLHLEQFQSSRIIEVRQNQSRERDDIIQKLKVMQKELNELDASGSLISEGDRKNEHSTADITSLRKSQLPYKQSSSSQMRRRKKSISESKMDSKRHQLLILN